MVVPMAVSIQRISSTEEVRRREVASPLPMVISTAQSRRVMKATISDQIAAPLLP